MKKQDDSQSASKLFIGGLTQTTTKEQLEQAFTKYGQIVDSIVMKNQQTGQSRGFGFVTFKDASSAQKALQQQTKIDNKLVDVKYCNPRTQSAHTGHQQQQQQHQYQQQIPYQQRMPQQQAQTTDFCKVFIGGLPYGVQDEEIKQFFTRYGPVKDFKMILDETKKPRGYGFLTFEYEDSASQALLEHYLMFKGKQIEVKPQSRMQQGGQMQQAMALTGGAYAGQQPVSMTEQSQFLAQQWQQQQPNAYDQTNWNYAQTPNSSWQQTSGYGYTPVAASATMQQPQDATQSWKYGYYDQASQQHTTEGLPTTGFYEDSTTNGAQYGAGVVPLASATAAGYGDSTYAYQMGGPSLAEPFQRPMQQHQQSTNVRHPSGGSGSSRQQNPNQQRSTKNYPTASGGGVKRQQTGSHTNTTASYHPYRR